MTTYPALTVYFDGLCVLCSREIDHYRKQQGSELIRFVDITHPSFDSSNEGLDPVRVHKVMHVKTGDGQLRTEVDAFISIWEVLPRYHFAARMARLAWLRPVLDAGYHGFARIRPWLPRRDRRGCEQSPYCETNSARASTAS
jgi:predicted DCC family thiol-disulfide oxidoreductase YuxK